ncbi:hypothetical protein BpHYR1_049714 [Brachionus plicatilis]|uniref:Uncharacterized protein n=1 Tax=Brachionus plicatilis TaxID=10195 RepID=A0A3M7RP72_BRAPC|nr:hypothetical protein BpHYR1_049714 [Brachionus plicatilis]
MHQDAFNKLKLKIVLNRFFELSERYVKVGLSHSVPMVIRLVEEYRCRYIEYLTPLCNCCLFRLFYSTAMINCFTKCCINIFVLIFLSLKTLGKVNLPSRYPAKYPANIPMGKERNGDWSNH